MPVILHAKPVVDQQKTMPAFHVMINSIMIVSISNAKHVTIHVQLVINNLLIAFDAISTYTDMQMVLNVSVRLDILIKIPKLKSAKLVIQPARPAIL